MRDDYDKFATREEILRGTDTCPRGHALQPGRFCNVCRKDYPEDEPSTHNHELVREMLRVTGQRPG